MFSFCHKVSGLTRTQELSPVPATPHHQEYKTPRWCTNTFATPANTTFQEHKYAIEEWNLHIFLARIVISMFWSVGALVVSTHCTAPCTINSISISALLTKVRALYLYVWNISATLVNHIIVEKYIFRDPEPRALWQEVIPDVAPESTVQLPVKIIN